MTKRTKAEWNQIMTQWKQSDLTMSVFCREKEINYWTFRENRKKREISSTASESTEHKLVKISLKTAPEPIESPPISLVISERFKLFIPDDFNKDTLQRIVNVLGGI